MSHQWGWLGTGREMRSTGRFLIAITVVASASLTAAAAPADLTTWTRTSYSGSGSFSSPGIWSVAPDGQSVTQFVNGAPTFFVSPLTADGYRISATFSTPGIDNDAFGVALGFTPPAGDPANDYLLIDWRQENQSIDWGDGGGPVVGAAGLAVSRVTGSPTWNELWGHTNWPGNLGGGVDELARAATLGNTGWADDSTYTMVLEYTTDSLLLWVNGVLQFDLSGQFPAGPFALYNFSLAGLVSSAISFEPLNSPPTVDGSGAADVTGLEGQNGTTSGSFTDPDGDQLLLSCLGPCTGFTDNGDGSWSWEGDLVEGPDSYAVEVRASDGELETADGFLVTVFNVAPSITSTSALPSLLALDAALSATAAFTDPGVLDTHTARFFWGDGTSTWASVDQGAGFGTASSSHLYTGAGFYTISVTVWDDDGGSDTATLGQIFVFDPNTFVTGGGWVTSPFGAWNTDPGHTGKGTFGFNAKYNRSGSLQGHLQFQLHKGINLSSTGLDYLIINNGVAVFEGWGRVNGESGYRFVVTATDERYAASPKDLFRITITQGGATIYDGSVYPGDGLPIVGKGIQIHKRG